MIPVRTLSNTDIIKYYNNNPLFNGVYSRDNLPKQIKDKKYIINMDSKENKGTHWVAINNILNDKCLYFDSFGALPPKEIISFMRTGNKTIVCNDYRIQDFNSIMCGYYCIDFLNNGREYSNWLLQYNPNNYKLNDKIVLSNLI